MQKRLYLSTTDKVLGGVCGGIAEYFEISAVILRVLFVVFAFLSGFPVVIYIILWLCLPKKPVGYVPQGTTKEESGPLQGTVEDAPYNHCDKGRDVHAYGDETVFKEIPDEKVDD